MPYTLPKSSLLALILLLALLPWSFTTAAAQGTLFVENGNVGIGTESPTIRLDVRGSDGLTQLRVEESSPVAASRTGLMLVNNGGVRLGYFDTSSGVLWAFNNLGGKFVANSGGVPNELVLDRSGNLTITGQLTTASSVVPDYVLAPGYELMSLSDLQSFIEDRGHLPNIPSAEEVGATGQINISDLQMRLLEKVEELTLYTLQQQKRIDDLRSANQQLEGRLAALEAVRGTTTPNERDVEVPDSE